MLALKKMYGVYKKYILGGAFHAAENNQEISLLSAADSSDAKAEEPLPHQATTGAAININGGSNMSLKVEASTTAQHNIDNRQYRTYNTQVNVIIPPFFFKILENFMCSSYFDELSPRIYEASQMTSQASENHDKETFYIKSVLKPLLEEAAGTSVNNEETNEPFTQEMQAKIRSFLERITLLMDTESDNTVASAPLEEKEEDIEPIINFINLLGIHIEKCFEIAKCLKDFEDLAKHPSPEEDIYHRFEQTANTFTFMRKYIKKRMPRDTVLEKEIQGLMSRFFDLKAQGFIDKSFTLLTQLGNSLAAKQGSFYPKNLYDDTDKSIFFCMHEEKDIEMKYFFPLMIQAVGEEQYVYILNILLKRNDQYKIILMEAIYFYKYKEGSLIYKNANNTLNALCKSIMSLPYSYNVRLDNTLVMYARYALLILEKDAETLLRRPQGSGAIMYKLHFSNFFDCAKENDNLVTLALGLLVILAFQSILDHSKKYQAMFDILFYFLRESKIIFYFHQNLKSYIQKNRPYAYYTATTKPLEEVYRTMISSKNISQYKEKIENTLWTFLVANNQEFRLLHDSKQELKLQLYDLFNPLFLEQITTLSGRKHNQRRNTWRESPIVDERLSSLKLSLAISKYMSMHDFYHGEKQEKVHKELAENYDKTCDAFCLNGKYFVLNELLNFLVETLQKKECAFLSSHRDSLEFSTALLDSYYGFSKIINKKAIEKQFLREHMPGIIEIVQSRITQVGSIQEMKREISSLSEVLQHYIAYHTYTVENFKLWFSQLNFPYQKENFAIPMKEIEYIFPLIESYRKTPSFRGVAGDEEKEDSNEIKVSTSLKTLGVHYLQTTQAFAIATQISLGKKYNLFFNIGTGQGKSICIAIGAVNLLRAQACKKVMIFTSYQHLAERDQGNMKPFYTTMDLAYKSIVIKRQDSLQQYHYFLTTELEKATIIYSDRDEFISFVQHAILICLRDIEDIQCSLEIMRRLRAMLNNNHEYAVFLDEFDLLTLDDKGITNRLYPVGLDPINNEDFDYSTVVKKLGLDEFAKDIDKKFFGVFKSWYAREIIKNSNNPPGMNDEDGKIIHYVKGFAKSLELGQYSFYPFYLNITKYFAGFQFLIGFSGSIDHESFVKFDNWFRPLQEEQKEAKLLNLPALDTKCSFDKENKLLLVPPFYGLSSKENRKEWCRKTEKSMTVEEWEQSIKQDIGEALEREQPILIFCNHSSSPILCNAGADAPSNRSDWDIVKQILSVFEKDKNAAKLLFIAEDHQLTNDTLMSIGKKNTITMSTVVAGRGVDIRVESAVEHGLHVLITHLPAHDRLLAQMKGRTARMEGKGTYSIIARNKELDSQGRIIQKEELSMGIYYDKLAENISTYFLSAYIQFFEQKKYEDLPKEQISLEKKVYLEWFFLLRIITEMGLSQRQNHTTTEKSIKDFMKQRFFTLRNREEGERKDGDRLPASQARIRRGSVVEI